MELVRVTEAAALAASRWMGRGDKEGADGAAVNAMRIVLSSIAMDGVVVIGEGEKDNAPMLYNGERIGDGTPPKADIAVDPIDGTTPTALGRGGALAVIAVSEEGTMFDPGPCVYMEKVAVGPRAVGAIDITRPIEDNLEAVAKAKGTSVRDVTAVILDRPRHEDMIADIRATGARIRLITDGDVAGAIATAWPESGVDILFGVGGTPEGVIAAAALKSMGGEIQGRLWPRTTTSVTPPSTPATTSTRSSPPTTWCGGTTASSPPPGSPTASSCTESGTTSWGRPPSPWSCGRSRGRSGSSRRCTRCTSWASTAPSSSASHRANPAWPPIRQAFVLVVAPAASSRTSARRTPASASTSSASTWSPSPDEPRPEAAVRSATRAWAASRAIRARSVSISSDSSATLASTVTRVPAGPPAERRPVFLGAGLVLELFDLDEPAVNGEPLLVAALTDRPGRRRGRRHRPRGCARRGT